MGSYFVTLVAFASPGAAQKENLARIAHLQVQSISWVYGNQILSYVDAPNRATAEAAAVKASNLDEEQRKRLVVQERG